MTPLRNRIGIAAVAAFGALVLVHAAAPRLLWNTTASAPVGLWRLQPARMLAVGQWLAVRPPRALARALEARGALPSGVLLLKQVAALAPTRVCRRGDEVLLDDHIRARAQAADQRGRLLPQWRQCRALRPDEVFLLNRAEGSLDSRYFGPLTRADVVAEARPWLTGNGG